MYAYRTPEMLVSVKYRVIAWRCALVGIFSSDQGETQVYILQMVHLSSIQGA